MTSAPGGGAGRSHLILTGATGYVGQAVVDAALAEGRRVTVLGRRGMPGARWVAWRLGEPLPAAALDGEAAADTALVHLAHDWDGLPKKDAPPLGELSAKRAEGVEPPAGPPRDLPWAGVVDPLTPAPPPQSRRDIFPRGGASGARGGEEPVDPNLAAALILRDSARALGVGRTLFISSLSARPDALNRYGRTKFAIEGLFDQANEASLRVGLVYGGPKVAMYGLLRHIVGLAPVLPMIRPGQPVQPIHRREVAAGILAAGDGEASGPVGLAGAEPIAFGRFLDTLARMTQGRGVSVVPLPLGPLLLACHVLNALPWGPKVDPERVLGLAGVRFVETRADLLRLGISVAPFAAGMAGEPAARRRVLAEGRRLLRYVLRAEPGGVLVRRYARAVGPAGALALPPMLRLWEPIGGTSDLRRRVALATALAEASPEGERALSYGWRAGRLAGLAVDLALDGLALPVRLVLGGLAR